MISIVSIESHLPFFLLPQLPEQLCRSPYNFEMRSCVAVRANKETFMATLTNLSCKAVGLNS